MDQLRGDLKIFSGSSFIALLFALLLAVFRGQAAAHLLPFSIALSMATLIAAGWYVFGQDWVMTIVFSSYWGWAYPIVLSIIAVFLLEIAINKARITSAVINFISNLVGSSLQLTPC